MGPGSKNAETNKKKPKIKSGLSGQKEPSSASSGNRVANEEGASLTSSIGSLWGSIFKGSATPHKQQVVQEKPLQADIEANRRRVRETAKVPPLHHHPHCFLHRLLLQQGDPGLLAHNRFCLEVHFPALCPFTGLALKVKPKRLFFNKALTIGKIIDEICKAYPKLQNRNNQPGAEKLLLGHNLNSVFPAEIPIHLLDPELSNGDTVQIYYVGR